MAGEQGDRSRVPRIGGWTLIGVGAGILGLGWWSALPYWTGQSCSMALLGFIFSLPVGVPLMLAGAFVLWAAGRRAAPPQAGPQLPARWGGVGVDIAAFLASTVLVLVVVFTLGDPVVRDSESGLTVGVLSLLACGAVLWAERQRLRRGGGRDGAPQPPKKL